MKKSDKFIIGTIVGGAIGSVLGLLFAPKPGKQTRQAVTDASKKAVDWGKKQAEKIQGDEASEDGTNEIDTAMKSIAKSARKIRSSFKSLKKQTVDPAIQKLAKTREQEFDV